MSVDSGILIDATRGDAAPPEVADEPAPPGPGDLARRRYTKAAIIGVVVGAVPFLFNLWTPWQGPNLLRHAIYENNFYEIQARALFHGHLWLPTGSIGIEGFVHDGRTYTYFGVFPSIIRMPILLFTSRLDGQLESPYMLAAWLLTGLFVSLLFWRIRIMVRGGAAMGRAEATAFGVLVTTVMGGSVLLVLAATPYVFDEDLMWSVCLTVASIFALLGVLERPTWGRVVASGLFMLGANLDRLTTGWACDIGAVLIAVWFGVGRGGDENRRWCLPVLVAALVPLAAGCAVNWLKFGVPFGLPVVDQVWSHVNAYRRRFLAANHNSEIGTAFIPANLRAYLQPFGLRFTPVFPFITLPASPAATVGGVLFDRRYRTASMPASMPLLFLLSCWGLVTAFRPKPFGQAAKTRFLLLATGGAAAALLLWGYIAPRYLADFMPFLILGSGLAMVDIWRRLEGRSRRRRLGWLAALSAVALFTIWANVGIAISPNEEWMPSQAYQFVNTQQTISQVTGNPLESRVEEGTTLPAWRPAEQLFIVDACRGGLYVSTGENYATVPSQQFRRDTWLPVQRGPAYQHDFRVTFDPPSSGIGPMVPLVQVGRTTLSVGVVRSTVPGDVAAAFRLQGPSGVQTAGQNVVAGSTHHVAVVTDAAKHEVQILMDGFTFTDVYVSAVLLHVGPASVVTRSYRSPALTLRQVRTATALCRSLQRGARR